MIITAAHRPYYLLLDTSLLVTLTSTPYDASSPHTSGRV